MDRKAQHAIDSSRHNTTKVKRKRMSQDNPFLDTGVDVERQNPFLDQGVSTPRMKKPEVERQHRRAGRNSGGNNQRKKKQRNKPIGNAKKNTTPHEKSSPKTIHKHQQQQNCGNSLICDAPGQGNPFRDVSASGKKAGKKEQKTGESKQKTGESKQKTGEKKQKKKPQSLKRIVCVAENTLIQCIDRKRSLGDSCHVDELVDIPKDQISKLPQVPYKKTKNPVVVISSAASSDVAVAKIRAELSIRQGQMDIGMNNDEGNTCFTYLGFDTETRPNFSKGGSHPPALIQMATQTTAYLFRLSFQGKDQQAGDVMTESLQTLLSDQNIIKIGVGIHKDVEDLKRVYGSQCGGDGTSYLDLLPIVEVRCPKLKRTGLRNLTGTLLRQNLSKAQQMKNWEMKQMTPAMEAYAAGDAWIALDLLAAMMG